MTITELSKKNLFVTTDSRDCPAGSIFLALKGASFDGNKFAASALEKGCAYAIIDEPEYAQDERYIVVSDCLATYKELARAHRRLYHIPVIGITGTNGKTTTKELVSAVLQEKYRVLFTEANYNNDVGVPKTLFRIGNEHEIAVVEMGASHPGDIEKLVTYVEPTCGLITNVGRAHLLGFGSFEGVKRTKGELYDFLKAHDCEVFINHDNEHLMGMAQERGITKTIYYGQQPDDSLAVHGELISCAPFVKFRWQKGNGPWHEVMTHLVGAYNLDNMLAAITVGLRFGVSEEQASHAISHYVPANNRSQLEVTAHNKLIVDAYNANPTSMAAALKAFSQMEVSPKLAILGDMRELGDVSAEEHQKIVDLLEQYAFDDVWLVGDEFAKTDCTFRKFADVKAVKEAISSSAPEGYYILIKGSNGIRLFELPALL